MVCHDQFVVRVLIKEFSVIISRIRTIFGNLFFILYHCDIKMILL